MEKKDRPARDRTPRESTAARGRETRRPGRPRLAPMELLPDEGPAAEEEEERMSDDGQRQPSGNPGGIGGPSPAPPGPSSPPPPTPPPTE